MSAKTYIDTHPLRRAFIANQLERLSDLIVEQGEALLADAEIEFPPRAVSAVLLIGERGHISAADIADALNQPHQLTTQRIELLIDAGIIDRINDPQDGRRKILQLTDKGVAQFKRLQTRLAETDQVFATLFQEISCDLYAAVEQAMDALMRSPTLERVKSRKKL